MTTSENESVDIRVERKVRRLLAVYDGLKTRNEELSERVTLLEQQLSETKESLADCRRELENLKCVKATQVSEEEARKMRNRMLKLEREVEKCISLLNE